VRCAATAARGASPTAPNNPVSLYLYLPSSCFAPPRLLLWRWLYPAVQCAYFSIRAACAAGPDGPLAGQPAVPGVSACLPPPPSPPAFPVSAPQLPKLAAHAAQTRIARAACCSCAAMHGCARIARVTALHNAASGSVWLGYAVENRQVCRLQARKRGVRGGRRGIRGVWALLPRTGGGGRALGRVRALALACVRGDPRGPWAPMPGPGGGRASSRSGG
jgi:hypothetical protein